MLYFIQSGSRIKIGRAQNPFNRFREIYTASPDECRLVLAIHVHNEIEAEARMHEALNRWRTNGEWFEINFKTAFWTLVELGLIPREEVPHLELPVVPPLDPDFFEWFKAVKGVAPWTDEELKDLRDNLDEVWFRHHNEFEEDKRRLGTLELMIKARQPLSEEEDREFWRGLREMLKQ